MIEQVIAYPFIIAVSLLKYFEFLNLVVFHGYDKIAFMMLCADENLAVYLINSFEFVNLVVL